MEGVGGQRIASQSVITKTTKQAQKIDNGTSITYLPITISYNPPGFRYVSRQTRGTTQPPHQNRIANIE